MAKRAPEPHQIEVVDDQVAAILRTKTPAERIEMGFELTRLARVELEGQIRGAHPDWTDQSVMAEVARTWLAGDVSAAPNPSAARGPGQPGGADEVKS
jgi:hypothetical protein